MRKRSASSLVSRIVTTAARVLLVAALGGCTVGSGRTQSPDGRHSVSIKTCTAGDEPRPTSCVCRGHGQIEFRQVGVFSSRARLLLRDRWVALEVPWHESGVAPRVEVFVQCEAYRMTAITTPDRRAHADGGEWRLLVLLPPPSPDEQNVQRCTLEVDVFRGDAPSFSARLPVDLTHRVTLWPSNAAPKRWRTPQPWELPERLEPAPEPAPPQRCDRG